MHGYMNSKVGDIAPSVEAAVNYLQDRYGADVEYKVKGELENEQ